MKEIPDAWGEHQQLVVRKKGPKKQLEDRTFLEAYRKLITWGEITPKVLPLRNLYSQHL